MKKKKKNLYCSIYANKIGRFDGASVTSGVKSEVLAARCASGGDVVSWEREASRPSATVLECRCWLVSASCEVDPRPPTLCHHHQCLGLSLLWFVIKYLDFLVSSKSILTI